MGVLGLFLSLMSRRYHILVLVWVFFGESLSAVLTRL